MTNYLMEVDFMIENLEEDTFSFRLVNRMHYPVSLNSFPFTKYATMIEKKERHVYQQSETEILQDLKPVYKDLYECLPGSEEKGDLAGYESISF
jgi:hypothetical protein